MDPKEMQKKMLENVQKSTKGQVTEQDVMKLAGGLKPSDVTNEQSLRQLIKQVSALANVPVSEQTIQQIIQAIKQSGINPNNMEQLMKLMQGK
jgi:Ca2+-binding EF-hand superfamily protein